MLNPTQEIILALILALLALPLNALVIVGVHRVTRDGYLFGFVERWWSNDEQRKEAEIAAQDAVKFSEWMESAWGKYREPGWECNGMTLEQAGQVLQEKYAKASDLAEMASRRPEIANPITECPTCMSSFWGALGFCAVFSWWVPLWLLWTVFPYMLALAGLVWIGRGLWEDIE